MTSITVALAFVLFVLAAFHVVWAVRNQFGDSVVLPKVDGRPVFIPTRASSIAVAAALLTAMLVALAQGQLWAAPLPSWFVRVAAGSAGSAFLLRAIGEFRLVGFFKRVRGTDFARWDTWCFSPLCVLMGSAFWFLVLA